MGPLLVAGAVLCDTAGQASGTLYSTVCVCDPTGTLGVALFVCGTAPQARHSHGPSPPPRGRRSRSGEDGDSGKHNSSSRGQSDSDDEDMGRLKDRVRMLQASSTL